MKEIINIIEKHCPELKEDLHLQGGKDLMSFGLN